MSNAISKEEIQELFDSTVQEMTEQVAGIRLYHGESSLGEEVCTVYADFERGIPSSVSLCADLSVFKRLTRHIMQEEKVSLDDVEDFTKEYFNVLCGTIAARLFKLTKVASRFKVPVFCYGRYEPEDQSENFVVRYFSDQNEGAHLTHHTLSD